jgi:hypothetical protein
MWFGFAQLRAQVESFKDALELFDFCSSQREGAYNRLVADGTDRQANEIFERFKNWPMIPARDGAMTIYHFSQARDGIYNSLAKCKTISPLVDRPILKAANKLFEKQFPDVVNMRDSVAHIAEQTKTKGGFEEHLMVGPQEGSPITLMGKSSAMLANGLNGRRYSNSWEGRLFSYEISQVSLDTLREVMRTIFSAFKKAEEESRSGWKSSKP